MSLSPIERLNLVKAKHVCLNCLSTGHLLTNGGSANRCVTCTRKYHSLLHLPEPSSASCPNVVSSPPSGNTTYNSGDDNSTSNASQHSAHSAESVRLAHCTSNAPKTHNQLSSNSTLLGTATAVLQHGGNSYPVKALIDPVSEVSFIAQALFKRIHLPWRRGDVQIAGVSGHASSASSKVCSFTLRSPIYSNVQLSCDVYVLPSVTSNLPSCSFEPSNLTSLSLKPLANRHFHVTAPVDVLLGSDMYPLILRSGVAPNILTGPISPLTVQRMTTTVNARGQLEQQLRAFWEIEERPTK